MGFDVADTVTVVAKSNLINITMSNEYNFGVKIYIDIKWPYPCLDRHYNTVVYKSLDTRPYIYLLLTVQYHKSKRNLHHHKQRQRIQRIITVTHGGS